MNIGDLNEKFSVTPKEEPVPQSFPMPETAPVKEPDLIPA